MTRVCITWNIIVVYADCDFWIADNDKDFFVLHNLYNIKGNARGLLIIQIIIKENHSILIEFKSSLEKLHGTLYNWKIFTLQRP